MIICHNVLSKCAIFWLQHIGSVAHAANPVSLGVRLRHFFSNFFDHTGIVTSGQCTCRGHKVDMFPVGGVDRYSCGLDKDVVISKLRLAAIGNEMGIPWASDLDSFLHGH